MKNYDPDPEVFFQKQFETDQLRNEKFRFFILLIVLSVLLLFAVIIAMKFDSELRTIFNETSTFNWVLLLISLLIIRSLSIQYYLSRRLKKRLPFYTFQRYLNALFEISIPSLAIIIFAQNMQPMYALVTPAVFLYFVFIIISALEMDWKLSVFTGTIAAIEYLTIAIYFLDVAESPSKLTTLHLPAPYIAKAGIMIICGVLSGLITRHLKKRVIQGYRLQEERSRMQNLFSQQVSPEIVDELINNKSEMSGQKRFVCVLFLDIRGFTPFCQDRTPEQIVQYQNDVFSFMIEIISKKQGIINQFLGDGFMATFGAPVSKKNDCQNAVEAAILINDEVQKRSQSGQIPATEIGIGIHAGDAVTGNVGTKSRQQYSITGNVVILAARLEQLNKKVKSRILISKEVFDQINTESLLYEWIGPVDIKGMDKPVEVIKIA